MRYPMHNRSRELKPEEALEAISETVAKFPVKKPSYEA
jgi:hypothetical protein